MSDVWGNAVKLSIFGESHGPAIGVVLDGIEPGVRLDMEEIRRQMARRAPGQRLSTPRKEADEVQILSGVRDGLTCGTSICAMIANTNTRSADYERTAALLRPSHADYTGHIKYKGFEDFRGGGHFSGRITAPIVFAGAVCQQILRERLGVVAGSHILQLYKAGEGAFEDEDLTEETLDKLSHRRVPTLRADLESQIEAIIESARMSLDSVGGIVETAFLNLPAGLGDPFFDSMESRISHLLFSVPAVKGVSFGSGFGFAKMKGSEANDPFYLDDGAVRTRSNHNGGILGGITSGMPLVFQTVIKPTASIARPQQTVNLTAMKEETLSITGRHDPCIVLRAIPVLEAMGAIAIYDAWRSDSFGLTPETSRNENG